MSGIKQVKITQRFAKDTRGNVAMMFGVCTLGLMTLVGATIDYSGMTASKQRLQSQVDASVLAAARLRPEPGNNNVKNKDRKAMAKEVLAQNGYDLSYKKPKIEIKNPTIAVTATAQYKTAFMGLIGKSTVDITATAESQINSAQSVEIALVLDNTASMGVNGKLAALQTGAKGLLATLSEFPSDQVSVGIVPFAKNVNVGVSNRGASWLEMPDEYTVTRPNQPTTTTTGGTPGTCTSTGPQTGTIDGSTYTYEGQSCSGGTPGTSTTTYGPKDYTAEWMGCVGPRPSNLHFKDETYSTRVPGLTYFEAEERSSHGTNRWNQCVRPITPLTNNFTTLNNQIDALWTRDSTYMPLGIAWGHRVLSPGEPFTEGASGKDVRKIMIVMTDGINTVHLDKAPYLDDNVEAPYAPVTPSNLVEQADKDTKKACNKAKQAGVEVITIAFQVTDTTTKTMLNSCATGNNNYYDAGDNAALIEVFEKIGSRLFDVRLTQ